MEDQRVGALVRAVRRKRGLRQQDVADQAGVSPATVSMLERGHFETLSLRTLRQVAASVDVRIDIVGRWRGGDADRLLSRRHSHLAELVAGFMAGFPGWTVLPEVSFAFYGERGIIDHIAWHEKAEHLLVVELKTEFADVNEMLGTLDRKFRLARSVASQRGWTPRAVSVWLIVSDTRTNRRHAAEHARLLNARFQLDGRQLRSFLRNPSEATSGMAFWTDSSPGNASQGGGLGNAPKRPPRGA